MVDGMVREALEIAPIVVLEGARGCGKTWTGLNHARSQVRLDDDVEFRAASRLLPAKTLEGRRPRLVDEWQLAPGLWNSARHIVDSGHLNGLFIFRFASRSTRPGWASPPRDSSSSRPATATNAPTA
ncbi:MAG: hypothetical protein OXG91_07390 [bacterium]|nr:hypothetical protein [bacterium]